MSAAALARAEAAASGSAIELVELTKTFWRGGQSTEALAAIDLTVKAGEFVCLLGPSGCGKSTLLHIVAGFIRPDLGQVLIDGRPAAGPGADRCMIFQSPTLFPWLSTRDNILFGPRAQGKALDEAGQEADKLLDLVGLVGFGEHYPHQLSGGMRHRAALARALINHPRVLLMDEPFAALDAITRASMQEFLLELWERERTTIVFVTHDVEEATLLADRVCIMSARPGRIMAAAEVLLPRPRGEALRDAPEFVALRHQMRMELARACR